MDIHDHYFASTEGRHELMNQAGLSNYQHRPQALIGKLFRFECDTPNDDDATPRESDHHVIYGTIRGVHFDGSISEIVLTVSNGRIGIDNISKIAFYLIGQRWYIESFDGEAYDDHDGSIEILS